MISIALIIVMLIGAAFIPATSPWLPLGLSPSGLLNAADNSAIPWYPDVLGGLCPWAHTIPELNALTAAAILTLGLFFRANAESISPRQTLERATLSMASVCGLLILLGLDAVVLPALCWIPWLVMCMERQRDATRVNAASVVEELLLALLLLVAGGPLAPFIYLFCCFYSGRPFSRYAVALGVLLACLAIYRLPGLTQFNYPPDGHVVSDDGLPGLIRPLIEPCYTITFIDRVALKRFGAPWAMLALLVLLAAERLARSERTTRSSVAVCLVLACLADTVLPEALAQISPLAALSRIFPGLFLLALFPTAIGLVLLTVTLDGRRFNSWFISLFIVGAALGIMTGSLTPALGAAATASESGLFDDAMRTPSRPVFLREGRSIVAALRSKNAAIETDVKDLNAQLTASVNADTLRRLLNGNPKDRWSSGNLKRSGQQGHEWIEIHFPAPIVAAGIQASPGLFPADFPREIVVRRCDTQAQDQLYPLGGKRLSWEGAPALTDGGLPFYRPQAVVEVPFESPIQTTCLRIEQLGKAPFDWSIGAIRIALVAP